MVAIMNSCIIAMYPSAPWEPIWLPWHSFPSLLRQHQMWHFVSISSGVSRQTEDAFPTCASGPCSQFLLVIMVYIHKGSRSNHRTFRLCSLSLQYDNLLGESVFAVPIFFFHFFRIFFLWKFYAGEILIVKVIFSTRFHVTGLSQFFSGITFFFIGTSRFLCVNYIE